MGMTLANTLSALRTDLKDPSTTWSDAELTRAIVKAYADLSRVLPVEKYYEQRLSFTVTAEAFTSAAAHGTYKALTYKPIKYESETVTNAAATVTYTRNTDYVVDYMNGQITTVSGGSMLVLTAYKITYTKSKIAVDMSSLVPIKIGSVEYPAHSVAQKHVSTELFANILNVQCGEDTQEEMSENKHILIQYFTEHTVPATAAGTCPAFLDETVNLAAAAYALFHKAVQYELQSVTDLASARTALGNIAAIHTLIGTALGKVSTYNTDADTALDLVKTNNDLADIALDSALANIVLGVAELANLTAIYTAVGTSLTAAETAFAAGTTALGTLSTPLAAIATALAKIDTYAAGGTESTKALLAQIATDAAALRTAIGTAVDAANAALDLETSGDFTTAVAGDTSESDAIAALVAFLTTGDDFINEVNTGADVGSLYAQFGNIEALAARAWAQRRADYIAMATARSQQATTYLSEAQIRLSNLSSYIEQARAYGVISDAFANEAQGRIGHCNQIIGQANQDIGIGNGYVSSAGMRLYEMDRYLGEADRYYAAAAQDIAAGQGWIAMSEGYIAEANGRIAMENAFIAEAQTRIAQIDRYTEEATRYTEIANIDLLLADKFRTEASERRNEAWSIWADKKQLTGKLADVSNRQLVR